MQLCQVSFTVFSGTLYTFISASMIGWMNYYRFYTYLRLYVCCLMHVELLFLHNQLLAGDKIRSDTWVEKKNIHIEIAMHNLVHN